jgi:hypothetical protein
MSTYNQAKQSGRAPILILEPSSQSSKKLFLSVMLIDFILIIILLSLLSGCSGPSHHRLPAHFESVPHGSEVTQGKLSSHSQSRLAVGIAIVLHADPSHAPLGITEDTCPQFAARVNQKKMQGLIPVSMQEVVRLDEIPSGDQVALRKGFKDMGENRQIEGVLVVLPSSKEVKGPAQFNVLPEVGTLNGYQIENHASVELGLLDLKSGKLLPQSQGTSYATLEELDTPLGSNWYRNVRGFSMTNPIYPEEGRALESLRMVALNEALDQAIMKFPGKWPNGQGSPILPAGAMEKSAPSLVLPDEQSYRTPLSDALIESSNWRTPAQPEADWRQPRSPALVWRSEPTQQTEYSRSRKKIDLFPRYQSGNPNDFDHINREENPQIKVVAFGS